MKSRISSEHNVFWICDRLMCLTISLITAGKLPGCSVWALCPCLDLHAVKFSGFKHPCDAALFLASLAHLQETRTVFEGDKTQSWLILQKSTQEWEEWVHPTQCLQRRLYRKEQMHIQMYLFPQKKPQTPPKKPKTQQTPHKQTNKHKTPKTPPPSPPPNSLRINYVKVHCNDSISKAWFFVLSQVR